MHTKLSAVCFLGAVAAWVSPVAVVCAQPPPPPPPIQAQPPAPADAPLIQPPADNPVFVRMAQAANKLPAFLKVDGVYIFDGSEDDLVKVLELDGLHGWARVQTKAGESWVNIANVTTITPVSKEEAAKSEMRTRANFIRDGAQAISAAIDDYATQNNLGADATFQWGDIRKLLKGNPTLYSSGGKDVTGRPYTLGPKVSDHVKISPETIKEFTPVIDDPDAFWGKFKP